MTLKKREVKGKLKEETIDSTQWRNLFGRGCGPVVRQTNNE
jgi:hypothetical protein